MKLMLLETLVLVLLLKRRQQSNTAKVSEAGFWCQFTNPRWTAKGEVAKLFYVICVHF